MQEVERSRADGEAQSLPDLSTFSLPDVLDSDDSVLANCVRRVLRGVTQPGEHYAAHGSTPLI